ncbi:hypothetical protein HPB50_013462 [Hyalomma asiaticum]|uniref:Uncharacterized protein n=1 Tax=Hyalomma asiaticum TaxID=266040 RepID=A0ACB7S5G8_HYAAI|nr:hypothetical protein HPB50_013462 [Hyalomma asiaticum]
MGHISGNRPTLVLPLAYYLAAATTDNLTGALLREQAADDEDDDDGPVMDLDGLRTLSAGRLGGSSHLNKPEDILQSTVDSAEWKLEVERVLPQLRVTVQPDAKAAADHMLVLLTDPSFPTRMVTSVTRDSMPDLMFFKGDWRGHLELIHQQRRELDEGLHVTRAQLEKLSAGLSSALDKLASREKYLNAQLEAPLAQYRSVQEALSRTREHYRTVSGGITDRSRTLAQITEELEQIKQEMEERGSSMTDGTPLVNIRKALTRLKTEITQMDVRIGVAVHTLLQAKIKEKGNLRDVVDAPTASYDSVY